MLMQYGYHSVDAIFVQLFKPNENHLDRVVCVRRVWDQTDVCPVLVFIRIDVGDV